MSNVVNDFTFQTYSVNQVYQQYDVVYGVNSSDLNFFYLTQDYTPAGGATLGGPRLKLIYNATAWERTDDLTTVYFTKTGSQANMTAGSHVTVGLGTAGADSCNGETMLLDGGSNYIKFLNPGLNQSYTAFGGGTNQITGDCNPAFSTGFFWVPSNTTTVDFETKRDFAQFGDGYSQQARLGINSIGSTINMTFENRSYREAKSILNFVQAKGGVTPVKVNLPVNVLFNNPATKYLLTNPKVNMKSYNLNDITVMATRIYN